MLAALSAILGFHVLSGRVTGVGVGGVFGLRGRCSIGRAAQLGGAARPVMDSVFGSVFRCLICSNWWPGRWIDLEDTFAVVRFCLAAVTGVVAGRIRGVRGVSSAGIGGSAFDIAVCG
ncbi:hypothetical protein [Nocardia wallacei]|uniref:hypothetical protein n=1 Tax=Nocardia wallacei TaxID=480035 RepID=UPI0024580B2F|nr:hypothetical protein [Nocardia wallacei]